MAIYTVRIGRGADCFLCLPTEGYKTLQDARLTAQALRDSGYSGVYILNHVTGQEER